MSFKLDIKNPKHVHALRLKCLGDFSYFCRLFFPRVFKGQQLFIKNHHLAVMQELTRVILGQTKILVVEMPPGFSKTTFCVHLFTAWGFAHNMQSRFVHTSYSDTLVKDNSVVVKTIMKDPLYKILFPYKFIQKRNASMFWKLEGGGGFRAVSSKGQVTGFGAGYPGTTEWNGAILIDDPLKPEDCYSHIHRERAIRLISGTVRTRRRGANTPIILFMQRLGEDDPADFVKKGGLGDNVKVLTIRAENSKGESIYPEVLSNEDIHALKTKDPYLWSTQYLQKPEAMTGHIFKRDSWKYYDVVPADIEYKVIVLDTAQKKGEANDYTVMQCWGFLDKKIYLLDQFRAKLEAPELMIESEIFFHKHKKYWKKDAHLRKFYIEDKSSGTGLIQILQRRGGIPVEGIKRSSKDKVSRAKDVVGYVTAGNVFLPKDAPWLSDFLLETSIFPLAKHDDQVDALCDAVDILLVQGVQKVIPRIYRIA